MPEPEFSRARILIVDDEPANVELLSQMLGRAGFENLASTSDSSAVMQIVKSFEPDILLLDLHMPAPDGYQLMSELQDAHDEADFLPVLVLTADGTDVARMRALSNGANDFLTKPFQYPELLLRLRNLLGLRDQNQLLVRANHTMSAELCTQSQATEAELDRIRAITKRTEAVLDGPGLSIVFQPVVDLVEGTVVGVEALARFPLASRIGPDVWFREAREVGLGVQLELAAIRAALPALDQLAPEVFLAINASRESIVSPALRSMLAEAPRDRLVLELTEHDPVSDYPELLAAIVDFREQGIRLAIDDTGAGYSSLHHILELGPAIVKLDRSLIEHVDTSPVRRSLVAALLHFSTETDALLIAEGIETVSELRALQGLGVRHGQGYLFARPAPLPVKLSHVPALDPPRTRQHLFEVAAPYRSPCDHTGCEPKPAPR